MWQHTWKISMEMGEKMNVFVFISLLPLLTTSLLCSCKELKSQSVISGWLNYHPNHCNPYKSPSGARTKISTTRKNREFKLLLAQALPGMCATKHPSQSSAVSIPHFLEQKQFSNFFQAVLKATKGFKPKVSFTAGCPQ